MVEATKILFVQPIFFLSANWVKIYVPSDKMDTILNIRENSRGRIRSYLGEFESL